MKGWNGMGWRYGVKVKKTNLISLKGNEMVVEIDISEVDTKEG